MRIISALILVSLSSNFSFAEVDACKSIDTIRMRMRMRVISSNIANVNTSRTPEGGAYRIRSLNCNESNTCEIVETSKTLLKYEPDHPDANLDGHVSYPDINLTSEMDALLEATRDYEESLINCKKQ